jgi:hypothetical protein
MDAGTRLLRCNSSRSRRVRISMRHGAELRDDERQGGDDRETQLLTMLQSCQGSYLKVDLRDASTGRANTELLHTIRRAARRICDATLIAFARKLRWGRQIAPKLEPQLPVLRLGSQRFRRLWQK